MVLRVWRGYTAPQDADTYEAMLRETILPGIHRIAGYRGAYLATTSEDCLTTIIPAPHVSGLTTLLI